MVLEKTLKSPLDCKEIKPVNVKRNQPRIFIGRTDAEAETAILWPRDSKNWLIRKDPDSGKDWKQWQIIFLGFKITADSDCSHEIKRFLLLGRKAMTNLDSILKSREITLPTKVHLVKAMVFLVVMYGCESCAIKKGEHWRTDAFELWCWRRLLRVPWTARRSNQRILKEISHKYSLEGLMLQLKLQYFDHLMQRADSLGKTLMLGKIEGRRRKGWQRIRWLDGITNSNGYEFEQALGNGEGHRSLTCCSPRGVKSRTRLRDNNNKW